MKAKQWEVWYANVRFEDETGDKDRPVIITEISGVHVIIAPVTGHDGRNCWGEVELVKWQSAGLTKESTVRLSKCVRLEEKDLRRRIGRLSVVDIMQIQKYLS